MREPAPSAPPSTGAGASSRCSSASPCSPSLLLLRARRRRRRRAGAAREAAAAATAEAARAARRRAAAAARTAAIVAFYGAPQAAELGQLGIGTPASAARKLREAGAPLHPPARPVLPAMELIAVVAAAHPGEGGRYSTRQPSQVIGRYLRAARKAKALLILDIQPGRSDFFTETSGCASGSRSRTSASRSTRSGGWRPGQVPGKVIGSVQAREVNATSAWLAQLVKERRPAREAVPHPPVHRRHGRRHAAASRAPGLAMVLNADGFGGQAIKKAKYHAFTRSPRDFFDQGFKLFYHEDTGPHDARARCCACGRRRTS